MKYMVLLFIIGYSILGSSQNQPKIFPEAKKTVPAFKKEDLFDRDYFIDDQHSYVGFRIVYFGGSNVRGRFNKFRGTAFYDSASRHLSVQLQVNATSINTGVELRDSDMKKESWLSTEKFPTITFKSNGIVVDEAGFDLRGELHLKNKMRIVNVRFSRPTKITKDWAGNDQVDFSGSFVIKRSDFEISGGNTWEKLMENGFAKLSDDVIIELEIHARRPDYQSRKKMLVEIDSTANELMKIMNKSGIDAMTRFIRKSHSAKKKSISSFTIHTIGGILRTDRKYDDAIKMYQLKDELYPEQTDTFDLLAICYLLKQDESEAKKYFRISLEKDPGDMKALEYLRLLEPSR